MSDLETLRRAWEDADTAPVLTRDALTAIVRSRARATRGRVTQRLRTELATYAAMTAGAIVVMIVRPPPAWAAATAFLLVLFGATGGVIFFKNRALQRVPIDGTLRESLTRMIDLLSGWMTIYLAAYMAAIASAGGILLALLARDRGLGLLWWLAAAGCSVAVLWGYASGREYIRREFGRHRDELRRALEDLEAV